MRHIAICDDTFIFQSNRILDKQWAKKFPGALWCAVFSDVMRNDGYIVATGDVALSHVRAGYWRANDVLVIQSLKSSFANKLINYGAKPWILTCFESPLGAFLFYDCIKDIAPIFPYRILFSGLFENIPNGISGSNYQVYFPSYHLKDLRDLVPWDERKFMIIVAANKYFNEAFSFQFDLNRQARFFYRLLRKGLSLARRFAVRNELQTKRLQAIEYFGQKNEIDVYGPGWNDLRKLPKQWQRRLREVLVKLNPQICENKIATISGYKFAICFENVKYPGYFTEKIVDCFVAGVIPIYLGAPDIEKYIPRDAYIDMRRITSWQELEEYLEAFTETKAMKMISSGREYLESTKGKMHSYEGFAEFIKELLPQENVT